MALAAIPQTHRVSRTARAVVSTVVAVAATAAGLLAVWNQIPSVSFIVDLLAAANPWWLLAALLAEIVAVLGFALIQQRLVADLGGTLTRRASVGLTITSGAISMALPAGTAFGAGYTYRRLRRSGLRPTDIGVAMVASAGLLTGTLALLYLALATPSLLDELSAVIGRHHTGVLVVAAGLLAVAAIKARRPHLPPAAAGSRQPAEQPAAGTALRRGGQALREYAAGCSTAARAISGYSWRFASGWAVIKWAADFAALVAATAAVGSSVDLVALASIYLGIQILRQIPLTPGGLGVIEAALLAGLIAAGAAAAPAAAAVVIYRALTFWLVLPAGAVAALLGRSRTTTSRPLAVAG